MNLHAKLELQFFLHSEQLGLVIFFHVRELSLLVCDHVLFLFLVVLLGYFGFFDVDALLLDDFLLEGLFLFFHVFHALVVVLVFFKFGIVAVFFDVDVGLLLLILKEFQFL